MQTHVTLTVENDIGYLSLTCDLPEKPATLDLPLLHELNQRLAQIEAQADTLTAIVIQSVNPKYFVVGANVNALQTLNAATIRPWVEAGHAVFNRLESLPLPTIARVQGYALGGGLELALACDFILARENAQFGQPEARLGMVTGWGASYRLPRRIGETRAKELCFTGKLIDAETAHRFGLVNSTGDDRGLDDYMEKLVQGFRQCGRLALAQTKILFHKQRERQREETMRAEVEASVHCISAADAQERIANFLARRQK